MKLHEIIYRDEYLFSEASGEEEIHSLTTELGDVESSSLLIIPNSKRPPDFSKMTKIPAAVLCDENCKLPSGISAIRADNPRAVMAYAYSRFFGIDYSKMKIIGITGTNGKTSTATFIKCILSDAGFKVGFIGTGKIEINGNLLSDNHYSMTTPDPSLLYKTLKRMENEECDAVVMEISSHALALEKVVPISFDYGVFTNLSPEHTDFHENMEEYFRAKCKLFSMCKTAVFNIDDDYARKAAAECKVRKITVGAIWRGDIFASGIENFGFSGISYIYHGKNFIFRMKLSLAGIYNVYNSMLATAVTTDMGIKPCNVKTSIGNINSIEGRFEIIKDDITVIIDYAHTDTAFESVMKNLHESKSSEQILTVIFGCGGERDRAKRPRMAKVAEQYADRIIVTSDNSRGEEPMDIISDIIHGFEKKSFEVTEVREEAIRQAILSSPRDGIVAVIGKGSEKYNIDKEGYHEFDEKKIIENALFDRKNRQKAYENKA